MHRHEALPLPTVLATSLVAFVLAGCWLPVNASAVETGPGLLGAVQTTRLVAPDGAAGDLFGASVAVDEDTLLVGAKFDDDRGVDSGAVYVFTRSGNAWTPQAKLIAADGGGAQYFGASVAIDDNTAIVGAFGDDDMGFFSGSVYVFTRSGTVWTQQAKLTAADGDVFSYFGCSVALDQDTALIGANGDGDRGANAGAAYVFTRSGTAWDEQTKLVPADIRSNSTFGASVDLCGDSAIVGAAESAYAFTRSATAWTQQARLEASDRAMVSSGFGHAVAIDGNTALIGAYSDNERNMWAGAAYIFTREAYGWSQQAKLTAADGNPNDFFGISVAVDSDTAVVGAHQNDDRGSESGSAYVFVRRDGVWTQQTNLTAPDGVVNDYFGQRVAVQGGNVVVGVPYGDSMAGDSGTAYLFRLGFASTLSPVYRFYRASTGTHFYTSDEAEMIRVRDTMRATYSLDGVCYYVDTANPANSVPLYRFYNKKTGTHLYTADEGEKNTILATLWAVYTLDGVAYHVSMSDGMQVHRFYNPSIGAHFYSSDAAEIAQVRTNLGHTWFYEGPAYLVAQ